MSGSQSPLAPIALFVFNRPDLLVNAVDSLLKNPLCADSDLYVFSDAPRANRPDDDVKVAAVRGYIRGITGFKTVHIEHRESNLGARMNIRMGIDSVLRSYDRVIALEDDLLVAPNFIDYMNGALDFYISIERVWCINGCSLNEKYLSLPESWPDDVYFVPRNNSYGWGIWKNRWEQVDFDLKRQWRAFRSRGARERLARAGADLPDMLRDAAIGRVDAWDVSVTASIVAHNGLCVTPVHSFVAAQPNAAGTHVTSADDRVAHDLGPPKWPLRFSENIRYAPDIERAFLQVYRVPRRTLKGNLLEAGSLLKWYCKAGMQGLRRSVAGRVTQFRG